MKIARTLQPTLFGLLFVLGGCGGGHADLYRFGMQPVAESQAAPPAAARSISILYGGARFEPAIDGDRILTVTGSQAAYVADARWVSRASDLFDSATRRAFDLRMPSAQMVRLVGAPPPDFALGIEVRRFEADYVGGAAAPPEIVIEARVRLVRWSDRTLVAEWPVTSRETAQENRVGPIVDAFDRGTATVVARIADLTQERLAALPPT